MAGEFEFANPYVQWTSRGFTELLAQIDLVSARFRALANQKVSLPIIDVPSAASRVARAAGESQGASGAPAGKAAESAAPARAAVSAAADSAAAMRSLATAAKESGAAKSMATAAEFTGPSKADQSLAEMRAAFAGMQTRVAALKTATAAASAEVGGLGASAAGLGASAAALGPAAIAAGAAVGVLAVGAWAGAKAISEAAARMPSWGLQLERMGLIWDRLFANIGQRMIEALMPMAKSMEEWLITLERFSRSDAFHSIIDTIIEVGSVMVDVIEFIWNAARILSPISSMISDMAWEFIKSNQAADTYYNRPQPAHFVGLEDFSRVLQQSLRSDTLESRVAKSNEILEKIEKNTGGKGGEPAGKEFSDLRFQVPVFGA